MQMGVISFGLDGADVSRLFGILDGPPIFVKEFVVAAVLGVVSFFLECAKERLSAVKGRLIFGRSVVGDEAIKRESIQVNVLASIDRLAVIADLGEIAAVPGIAHVLIEKFEAGLGGREGGFFVDVFLSEGAEKPQLSALQRQKLLAGR